MNDIGCGVESVEQLIPSLRLILKCLRRLGLKLPPEECVFRSEKVNFLENVIEAYNLERMKLKSS